MNNFHYNQDPLYAAAAAILAGKTLDEQIDQLDEYESPHKTKAQKLQNVRDRIKETQERIAKIRKDQSAGEDSRGPRGDWLRIIDMHNADLKKLIAREKKIMKMTEEEELEEGLEAISSAVEGLKKGDKTNFGVVTDIGSNSISFKAKDLPITKIPFNQRKMGSSDYVLDKLVKLKESVELQEAEKYLVPYILKLSGGRNNKTQAGFSNLSSAEEFAKDNYSWVQPVLSQTETDKILKQAEIDMNKSKQLVNGQEEKDYKVTISGVPVTVTVYRWKMTAADKRSNPNPNGNTGLSNDYMYRLTFDKQYKGIHDPDMGKAAQNAKKLGLKYNSSTSLWEETESIELDEAKGVNPVDLRNIISNHTQLLTKATTPSAKEFHKVAIANAKEKLKALGEDADSMDEVLDPDAEASVWIDDFVKSDDPKFDGKSKDERIKMALGAWYAAQKKESVETTEDTLEEAVPLPTVQKIIAKIDEMSPKEYSNFLHALSDNAFGIATSTASAYSRINPGVPTNAKAWRAVADSILDAAKAYDARPVKMSEGVEDETQTLEEGVYPLSKKALDVVFALDTYEFEQFLKVLATTFAAEGKKSGFDEMVAVADHLEKAYKIWKTREFKEATDESDELEEVFRPGADMVPAPIGKDTATSQGLKKLWGVQMRAGKWADTFVGLWDDSSDKPFGIIDAEGVTRYADITKFMTAFSKLTK